MVQSTKWFHPEIVSYTFSGFQLGRDLEKLRSARKAYLHEAAVLYSTRMLEALSVAALNIIGLDSNDNSFSNLERLQYYNLIPLHTLYWAHALRRMGNAVRHAKTEATAEDEKSAVAFLEFWLRWFFCDYRYGPRLKSLCGDPKSPILLNADEWPYRIMSEIESRDFDPVLTASYILNSESGYEIVLRSSSISAVLAEKLLGMGCVDQALSLLNGALLHNPDDLRLLQLKGLAFRRANRMEEALSQLEPLYRRYSSDDEMAGIMAAVYKEFGVSSAGDSRKAYLLKSHRAYESRWSKDKKNTYLGINVATSALLLGDGEKSAKVAESVRKMLINKDVKLKKKSSNAYEFLNLWDLLTLAEAELLLGNEEKANSLLKRAVSIFGDQSGSLEAFIRQATEIRQCKGLSRDASDIQEKYMTYRPLPINTSGLELPPSLTPLVERLAEHVHDVWAIQRLSEGWTWGSRRDDKKREHPDLIPYSDLPDNEKEYDRLTVIGTLKAILALGYKIEKS